MVYSCCRAVWIELLIRNLIVVGGYMRVDRSQDDTTGLFVLGLAIVMLGLLFHYPWVVALGLVILVFGMISRHKQRRNKPPE